MIIDKNIYTVDQLLTCIKHLNSHYIGPSQLLLWCTVAGHDTGTTPHGDALCGAFVEGVHSGGRLQFVGKV